MQQLIILFFLTGGACFLATLPPGLLNMNAAKTGVEKGKSNGVMFGLGVAITVMVQAYVSVRIAKYLLRNDDVIEILLKIALIIFGVLALVFFFKGRKQASQNIEIKASKKRNSFSKGVALSSINLLSIPFLGGINTLFHKQGMMSYAIIDEVVFILASGVGTFLVMYLYVFYFNKMEHKTKTFSKNSNYILAALMLVLFTITLVRLIVN